MFYDRKDAGNKLAAALKTKRIALLPAIPDGVSELCFCLNRLHGFTKHKLSFALSVKKIFKLTSRFYKT
jgi:hypothetical protein